jgi:6-phosphofructokinase 1
MDTVHRIEAYCRDQNYDLVGIGVPKTVDNDLFGTDHTPGFPSAAWWNILSVRQVGRLTRDMRKVDQFTIFQTIGRDAGWLAASTTMARLDADDPPHLVYVPEIPFDPDRFVDDARRTVDRLGYVSVVVSEGVKLSDGTPVSASRSRDKFDNIEYGAMGGASAALSLHGLLAGATEWRGEFQIPESLPMCAADRQLEKDREEARLCGRESVRLADAGKSGVMVTIERKSDARDAVSFETGYISLEKAALTARNMPPDYMDSAGNDVSPKFREYMEPLIPDVEPYADL